MRAFTNHRGRWSRASVAAGLVLLVAACTAYQPRSEGRRAPGSQAGYADDGFYRVRKGDTLSSIATRHGIDWPRLAEANGIRSPDTIYAGQMLRIPDVGERVRPTRPARNAVASVSERSVTPSRVQTVAQELALPERRPPAPAILSQEIASPPPAPAAVEPAAPPPEMSDGVYRVRAGDHLLAIARKLDMPMRQIAALNDLEAPYRLRVGQELRLPVAVAGTPMPMAKPVAHIAAPSLSGDGFLWPVRGKIVGRFGQSNNGLRRDGINIAARKGTPVHAAEDGVVVYADEGIRGYGRMILLRHDRDYVTTYAHNAALLVAVGDVVRRGQVIARVGDTGGVDDAQLHFEIRKGRKPIDPEELLVQGTTALASSQ